MKNDSIKKYLIPNIPYLFVLWAFLKLGTAYRLAAGADFAHKLMGLGQTIGPAFADFAPGLAPFDWLVGIVGAVAFRVMVYVKSKNAKKFRRDEEYGSARWGSEKDIHLTWNKTPVSLINTIFHFAGHRPALIALRREKKEKEVWAIAETNWKE